jgi:rhamnogalacturonan endolyase
MNLRIFTFILALAAIPSSGADLFRDDFSKFPPGWLTSPVGSLNAAIQEYHYLPHRGVPLGPWEMPIAHLDSWMISDEGGKSYLEEQLDSTSKQWSLPLFITGDPEWSNYTVEVRTKFLSLREMAGVVFRYHTNRHYYLFALADGNKARISYLEPLETALRVTDWKELASAPFPYDTTRYHTLMVESATRATRSAAICSRSRN